MHGSILFFGKAFITRFFQPSSLPAWLAPLPFLELWQVPFASWLPAATFLVGVNALTVAMDFGFQRQAYPDNSKLLDAGIAHYAPGARSLFIASTQVSHGFPFTLNRNLV